jgi:hypothetical protein
MAAKEEIMRAVEELNLPGHVPRAKPRYYYSRIVDRCMGGRFAAFSGKNLIYTALTINNSGGLEIYA